MFYLKIFTIKGGERGGKREKGFCSMSGGFQGALPELLALQPSGCAKPSLGHDLFCGSALGQTKRISPAPPGLQCSCHLFHAAVVFKKYQPFLKFQVFLNFEVLFAPNRILIHLQEDFMWISSCADWISYSFLFYGGILCPPVFFLLWPWDFIS